MPSALSDSDHGVPLLSPGTAFGRYEIIRVLGMGGMGVVYQAQHRELRKPVAIKVLRADLAQSLEARTRFLREGEAVARIRHPHVVDVSDVGTHGALPFLVMEYLDGEDLFTLLARERPLSAERTLDILLPIIAGVAVGHELGVVHRDLKPSNIFLARGWDGQIVPKALDFGVSKLLDARPGEVNVTKAGAVYGTVQYMSPEQARGDIDVGPASDQYALGEILYECLTGYQAYPGESTLELLRRISAGQFIPPRQLAPELPAELEAIVLRAMSLDAAGRFPTLAALGRALLPFASLRAGVLWGETFGVPALAAAPAAAPFPARGGDTLVLGPETKESERVPAAAPSGKRVDSERRRRSPLVGVAGAALAAVLLVPALMIALRPRTGGDSATRAGEPEPTSTPLPVVTPPAPTPAPAAAARAPGAASPATAAEPEPAADPRPGAAGAVDAGAPAATVRAAPAIPARERPRPTAARPQRRRSASPAPARPFSVPRTRNQAPLVE